MKLIHCADLHLDSRLLTNLDRDRAKKRRDELLRNFARLAAYAAENEVEAILISGDLFDRDTVSALARNTVLSVISAYPDIRFYYLRGNHDTGDCLRGPEDPDAMPENLFLFGSRWKTWHEGAGGRIAITGLEQTGDASGRGFTGLRLDPDCFNILMLHGQVSGDPGSRGVFCGNSMEIGTDEIASGSRRGTMYREARPAEADRIDLGILRGRGIDYLALGHIHSFRCAPLDGRGIWCYPGCLEGRGFDESGRHGFVLLEIDEDRLTMRQQFIPFAQRTMYRLPVDVTGCLTTAQMADLVENAVREAGCTGRDMADVILEGELDVNVEKDTGFLRAGLEARFFFARLTDATTLRIEAGDYLYDESLRGEFVRLVMEDPSIPEEEKTAVIRCGFRALDGEEPV